MIRQQNLKFITNGRCSGVSRISAVKRNIQQACRFETQYAIAFTGSSTVTRSLQHILQFRVSSPRKSSVGEIRNTLRCAQTPRRNGKTHLSSTGGMVECLRQFRRQKCRVVEPDLWCRDGVGKLGRSTKNGLTGTRSFRSLDLRTKSIWYI